MKATTQAAARVLSTLIEGVALYDSRTFDNAPGVYMSLVVERIGTDLFSITHYGRQNGDAMRDPEMLFYRNDAGLFFAAYYRNDYVGLEQESIRFDDAGKPASLHPRMQRDHTSFANTWMRNIREQQLASRAA